MMQLVFIFMSACNDAPSVVPESSISNSALSYPISIPSDLDPSCKPRAY